MNFKKKRNYFWSTNIKLIVSVGISLFLLLSAVYGLGLIANALEESNPISYAVVPDGVYAFKNQASGFYMDIRANSRETGAFIQQYAYGSVPDSLETRSGLYRVEKISNTDYYVIRTLRDSSNCLSETTDGSVVTKRATTYIPNSCKWKITYSSGGYTLSPYSSNDSKVISVQNTTSSGSAGGLQSLLKIVSSSSDTKNKWQLYPYTGSVMRGGELELNGDHIVYPGQSLDLSGTMQVQYYYSTVVGELTPGTITGFSLRNPSNSSASVTIATISNNIISGVSGKTGMVAVKPIYSTGCTFSNYPMIYIAPGTGEFFYLTYSDSATSDIHYATNVGYYVRRQEFNSDPSQIWEIVRTSNDSSSPVLIRNVGTGYYLTSSSSHSENATVRVNTLLQSNTGTYDKKQLWYIPHGENSFPLQSVYQKENNSHMCVSFPSNLGSSLVQVSNFTYLNKIPLGEEVVLLGISDFLVDRCARYHRTAEMLMYNYDSFSFQFYVTTKASTILKLIETSKICYLRSHASADRIVLNKKQNESLEISDIVQYSQSHSFNNVDIIAFIGCKTAKGTNTITHAAYNAGARVSIGTTASIGSVSANDWLEFFSACMSVGLTVAHAVQETNEYIAEAYPDEDNLFPCQCIYVGDGTFTLP